MSVYVRVCVCMCVCKVCVCVCVFPRPGNSYKAPGNEKQANLVTVTSSEILYNGLALNADWLTAVVYQTVYHRYDKAFQVPLSMI